MILLAKQFEPNVRTFTCNHVTTSRVPPKGSSRRLVIKVHLASTDWIDRHPSPFLAGPYLGPPSGGPSSIATRFVRGGNHILTYIVYHPAPDALPPQSRCKCCRNRRLVLEFSLVDANEKHEEIGGGSEASTLC